MPSTGITASKAKRVFIVGAGGFGREVFSWMQAAFEPVLWSKFSGFLDDNVEALAGFDLPGGHVFGRVSGFQPEPGDFFVCGIGQVELKERVCKPIREAGGRFLQVIHPTAVLGHNVQLGEGVVLCPRVTLTCNIELGEMVMINCHSSAGHDVRVGAWSTISGHCDLTGNTRIGERAFLGSGVSIIPSKTVGDGALVGAGSVVIRSVPDGKKVFGNPAKVFA